MAYLARPTDQKQSSFTQALQTRKSKIGWLGLIICNTLHMVSWG